MTVLTPTHLTHLPYQVNQIAEVYVDTGEDIGLQVQQVALWEEWVLEEALSLFLCPT